jgi:hypothetical protein
VAIAAVNMFTVMLMHVRTAKDVSGYVSYDNGAAQSFNGDWVNKGEIEGYDGFGNSCDVEVD